MLTQHIIHTAVEAALAEDAPYGDITCETTIPADETGSAHLTARENGVMSGIEVFRAAFTTQNPAVSVTGAIRHVREQVGHTTHIEVEVDSLEQIPAVLEGGADTIMLDNFSLDDTRRGVELIDGKAIVEASGNMNLERVPAVAAAGVDVISVGALTHSVRSIDLGLDWI